MRGRIPPCIRVRRGARHPRDQHHPAGSLPDLSHRADRAPDQEPWRGGRDRRIRMRADPDPFRLPARHQYRGGPLTIADSSAFTRSLRDVFDTPDLAAMDDAIADGTFELTPGTPRAAGAVPRRACRLFAAPALSLHRHRSGAFPELRDLHELPVLCRCLRAALPAAPRGGRGRSRSLRCARQCDHAQRAGWRRHHRHRIRRASRRCRRFIWSSPAIAASP